MPRLTPPSIKPRSSRIALLRSTQSVLKLWQWQQPDAAQL